MGWSAGLNDWVWTGLTSANRFHLVLLPSERGVRRPLNDVYAFSFEYETMRCGGVGDRNGEGARVLSYLTLIGSPALPYASVAVGVILLALVIGIIDVLCRDDTGVRLLPRWGWFLVVVMVPVAGTVVWLIFGRPRPRRLRRRRSGERRASASVVAAFPEYDRPGRFVPQDPVADAEFLRQVRQRAEEQRRLGEIERRRRQQEGDATA